MAAHAAQGQTLEARAILNLKIVCSASAMSSYVALTRVKRREDLLMIRLFPQGPFCKRQMPDLELLFQVWQGEHIDWQAIEQEHKPRTRDPGCVSV